MTPALQDGDNLIFLLWCERLGNLVDSIQQIILDFLEGRHDRLELGVLMLILMLMLRVRKWKESEVRWR